MPEKHAGASALLDLAADLMEEFGWQTEEYFENLSTHYIVTADAKYAGGAMCTEGAIRAANRLLYMSEGKAATARDLFLVDYNPVVEMARDAVRELIPPDPRLLSEVGVAESVIKSIPWWNDEHCCSKEQAVGVLRDAATKTRPDA